MYRTQVALKICGWSSVLMGLIFMIIPEWYADLEGASNQNIGWLRSLGAALFAVNGVGALVAAKNPIQEKSLYDVVLLASVLETLALGWSVMAWEFSATAQVFITGPLVVAIIVSLSLYYFRPDSSVDFRP